MKHIKGSKAEIEFAKRIEARRGDWNFHLEEALLFLIEDILRQMEKKEISRSMLANQIGVSRSYITQVLSGKPNLRLSSIFKICFALGLKPKIRFENIDLDDQRDYQIVESGSIWFSTNTMPSSKNPEKKLENIDQYHEV